MKVSQVMKSGALCCHSSDTLMHAAEMMRDHDCGSIVVKDDDGVAAAMITDRDICMAALREDRALGELRVSSAMSRHLFSCAPSQSISSAERIMRTHQVRRLPVITGDGRLVGLLSLNDLAVEAERERTARRKEVTFAEVGETLRAVCQPQARQLMTVAP